MNLSVVVPVFNSQFSLPELARRLAPVLEATGEKYELILVNDGSQDQSWNVIRNLVEQYKWIRGIDLMRNYGQQNALLCGIRNARHEFIVTMDDDLQHPPEEIPKLLDKLASGFDVVYGAPVDEQHTFWRNLASRFIKLMLRKAMNVDTARDVSAFRAFRTDLRTAFANYESPFVSIDVLLAWGTTRFAAVAVPHHPRRTGESNYTLGKLITHGLNMTTGFSTLPLQLASLVGFSFTFFGVLILIYVVGRYLIEGGSVPGFPFLASIIAIFSGAQLFALGIIGEYLARMYFRAMGRPSSVTRETVAVSASPKEEQTEHAG
ncbi:MAG: glycosyltransferase [Candidatus Abyssobacteria bacterium SURF_5]|uniref:Glycosyltransferase n=1 Tax=Abyssobacteria bacterium (strain SURF_5) TaxID=2093360 RepID=A0A3A4P6K7_ABYX5|nr:MAG: glycosyltransferase [Candidatus Abyssubacteria bacterium SURF_5]